VLGYGAVIRSYYSQEFPEFVSLLQLQHAPGLWPDYNGMTVLKPVNRFSIFHCTALVALIALLAVHLIFYCYTQYLGIRFIVEISKVSGFLRTAAVGCTLLMNALIVCLIAYTFIYRREHTFSGVKALSPKGC
jgi:hypothetical protein